jgi:hypothetical protein
MRISLPAIRAIVIDQDMLPASAPTSSVARSIESHQWARMASC